MCVCVGLAKGQADLAPWKLDASCRFIAPTIFLTSELAMSLQEKEKADPNGGIPENELQYDRPCYRCR